jgi:uncharacterized protein YtpQ (UPF0354 family)
MLDALRAKLEKAGLEVLDISLQELVVRSEEKEATLSLHNLYRLMMTSERIKHSKQIDHFVQQVCIQLSQKSPKEEGQQIFPLLAPDIPDKRLYAPWSAPLSPNQLRLLLCEEKESRMRLFSPMDVIRSGRSMMELKKEAMNNLFRISSEYTPEVDLLGQYRFEIGDGYDASRFLMIRHWFPEQAIWVALPARDSLWIRESAPNSLSNTALKEAYDTLPYPILRHWIQLPSYTLDPNQQEHL